MEPDITLKEIDQYLLRSSKPLSETMRAWSDLEMQLYLYLSTICTLDSHRGSKGVRPEVAMQHGMSDIPGPVDLASANALEVGDVAKLSVTSGRRRDHATPCCFVLTSHHFASH
eukprot:5082942-Amphidinium_carterae.1